METTPTFTCPDCGSHFFGSSGCNLPIESMTGHCHGTGCKFMWSRKDDALYFSVHVKMTDLDKLRQKRQELGKSNSSEAWRSVCERYVNALLEGEDFSFKIDRTPQVVETLEGTKGTIREGKFEVPQPRSIDYEPPNPDRTRAR